MPYIFQVSPPVSLPAACSISLESACLQLVTSDATFYFDATSEELRNKWLQVCFLASKLTCLPSVMTAVVGLPYSLVLCRVGQCARGLPHRAFPQEQMDVLPNLRS